MNFELTTDQEMFQKMAREFAERELLPVAQEYDQTGKYPYELYKKMAPLGLLAELIPQKYGGLELGVLTWVLILEELAWGSLSLTGVTQNAMLPGGVLTDAANEEQKQKYLPPMCRGEKIYAVAVAEPNAGSDGGNIETKAILQGDSWVLNGNKVFVTNGNVADMIIALVQTDKSKGSKGLALIAVDKSCRGISAAPIEGLNGMPCDDIAQVRFSDCIVPKGNLISEVGRGLKLALGGITNMRISIGANCVGLSQRCIDIAVKYAQGRRQFGKPIGSFQLVQGLIAEMVLEAEAGRLLTRSAAFKKDKGIPCIKEVSMAKLFCSEMAVRTTVKAIRIHGGYGGFEGYTVERLNREAINFLAPGGTCEVHKLTIGRQVLELDALSR
ncbi:MAG: acyl-CoA dehydrogenase family protein [Deltaproteobacteria bacterium]|nr:acyl-CoA dehydrogenase family protein [Deltaproteobacteria bacterium]